ncbi:MAG: hypothetical protein KDB53_01735, partial [Planctomycetes bacterium]|nr:hypothetical protein [Planctomycetota bacterium]
MKKHIALLGCLLAFVAVVPAQTTVTVATDNIGYSGSNNGKCVVRDSQGVLYMVRMAEPVAGTRTLVMDASYDGGMTWLTLITSGINDANSGETGTPLVAQVSVAIDDQDKLHVIWQRGTSGLYNQYYCSIDPFALTATPYIDLKALMGVNLSTQTGAAGIAVDANGTVWMAMGSSSSWRAQLIHSDTPYATTGTFTSVGQISAAASAQSARIAVDLNGVIHCTYYENTGTGDYRHRAYDPVAASWSVATDLGNLSPTNDYTGAVVCDYLGNAHMVSMRDSYTSSGASNPTIVYYKRDAAGTFSAPITVMSATNAQYATVGNQYIFDIACDEVSGDVYVVFRDFSNGGELTVHVLPFGASSFTPLFQIAPANSGQHYYYAPRIRGSLYPASNNTGSDLHFTWRQMWPAPYDLKFLALGGTMPPTA